MLLNHIVSFCLSSHSIPACCSCATTCSLPQHQSSFTVCSMRIYLDFSSPNFQLFIGIWNSLKFTLSSRMSAQNAKGFKNFQAPNLVVWTRAVLIPLTNAPTVILANLSSLSRCSERWAIIPVWTWASSLSGLLSARFKAFSCSLACDSCGPALNRC